MKMQSTLEELEKTLYGRTEYDGGALALCWSLSGFAVKYRAERAVLNFVPDYSADQPCYIKIVLDGSDERKYAISTGKEKIIIENPLGDHEPKLHTLRLIRLSEGNVPIKISAFEITGDECEIQSAPELPPVRFEFVGDSITCGYGDLSARGTAEFRTSEEDPTRTYAYMTARRFAADTKKEVDIRVEAISGQGIVKNCAGQDGNRIPDFFMRESPVGSQPHDFKSWIPDVVVVNAGTNDMGGRVPDDVFRSRAGSFIDRIRQLYPEAHLFWVFGMMGQRYDAVLASLIREKRISDERVHYVPVRPIYEFPDETGANGHPNEKGHSRAARILLKAIHEALGI